MANVWSEQALEFLELMFWGMEKLCSPSLQTLDESFESWQWRHGWRRQTYRLEEKELILREKRAGQLVLQLTELGRLAACGGRDPEARWQRLWDGQWRMIIFDLPGRQQLVRQRLLRWLRQNGFGYLQNSVWIHPDPLTRITDALQEFRDDVESFTVMESHCCSGYSDAAIVHGAWDFDEVNKRYEAHLSQANGDMRKAVSSRDGAAELRRRLRQERIAWANAAAIDPFLPQILLPKDYLGQRAWQAHRSVMRRLVQALIAQPAVP